MANENVELMVEKAEALLAALAEKAGVATEHFWPLFVRQQIIEAAVALCVLAVIAVGMFSVARLFPKQPKNWDTPPRIAAYGTAIGIVAFAAAAIGGTHLPQLLNPEYYALQDVAWMLRGGDK